MLNRLGAILVLAAVPALSGCPQQTALWVESGSTAQHLVFGVAKERGGRELVSLTLLRVDRFDRDSGEYDIFWGFGIPTGTGDVAQIVYGEIPAGAEPLRGVAREALPLTEGCYLAYDTGTGSAVFLVQSDGHVQEVAVPGCQDVPVEAR